MGPRLSSQLASLPYSKPFLELSSSQLEALARHADALESRVSAGRQPRVSVNLDGVRPITWVHVLQGRWILVASCDSSVSDLSLWPLQALLSVEKGQTRPPATATAYLQGPVAGGIVDILEERVVIALEIRSPYVAPSKNVELSFIVEPTYKP